MSHQQLGPAGREHSVISQFTMTDSFHSAAGPDQSVPINHVSQQSRNGSGTLPPILSVRPCYPFVCARPSYIVCISCIPLSLHASICDMSGPFVAPIHVAACVTVLLTNVWRLSNHSFSHREARSGKYVFARRAACSKNHLKMGRLLRFVGFIREIS